MFLSNQNILPKPAVVENISFEAQLAKFKQTVIEHVAKSDTYLAEQVTETLNNEAELSTKIIEACTVVLQTRIREMNEDALQMFAYWSKGSNLDAKAADLGLERQILDAGDPNAFPAVAPKVESDEHFKTRYFLAPFSFSNAGPKLGYKYHAMTLGERPVIKIESPEANKVVVTYQFNEDSLSGLVKDATAERTDPGKVTVSVLARAGDGTPDAALISAEENYFLREDVAPATDEITIQAATIINYDIVVTAFISNAPDSLLTKAAAETLLQDYANERHKLGEAIEPSMIYHILHQAGAKKINITQPAAAIEPTQTQAAFCQSISVTVDYL